MRIVIADPTAGLTPANEYGVRQSNVARLLRLFSPDIRPVGQSFRITIPGVTS